MRLSMGPTTKHSQTAWGGPRDMTGQLKRALQSCRLPHDASYIAFRVKCRSQIIRLTRFEHGEYTLAVRRASHTKKKIGGQNGVAPGRPSAIHRLKRESLVLRNARSFVPNAYSSCHIGVTWTRTLISEPTLGVRFAATSRGYHEKLLIAVVSL